MLSIQKLFMGSKVDNSESLWKSSKTIILFTTMITAFLIVIPVSEIVYAEDLSVKTGGYIKPSFSYSPGDTTDASEFKISNARVTFSGTLLSKTSYGIQIDAVRDDILVDAFIIYKALPSLSIKAGQFKTAYSTDNLIPATKIAFINRPYLKADVSPNYRDIGLQVSYNLSIFDLTVGVMNGSGQNKKETNNNKSMAYRVTADLIPELQLSANFYTGKNDTTDTTRDEFINIGANGIFNGFEYSGEYARKVHGKLTGSAFFGYITYDWNTPFNRIPMLTPALRVELSDPDTDTKNDAYTRYTLGVTVNFGKKYTDRVMINYEIREAETGDPDNAIDIEYTVTF